MKRTLSIPRVEQQSRGEGEICLFLAASAFEVVRGQPPEQ